MGITKNEANATEQAPKALEFAIPGLSPKELAEILIKTHDIREGLYDLSVEFTIGVGAVGPNNQSLLPGAVIGVSRIGLVKSTAESPLSVDASVVNPPKKERKKRA